MKKKIEADLLKLAEKIIQEKGELDVQQLKERAKNLYEKLTILAFTRKHLEDLPQEEEVVQAKPIVSKADIPAERNSTPQYFRSEEEYAPDGTEYNDTEAITEPATEKIKDIVAQMPPESEDVDRIINRMNTEEPAAPAKEPMSPKPESRKPDPKKPETKKEENNDFRHIGVDYDNLPNFEPLNNRQKDQRPKSLNDRLKKGINIGLNERLAYIKQLFDGNTSDYNRVLSQLNTFSSLEEAQKFIQKVVKPDYNNWEGKEEYEQRFMEVVESKFSK
ncbi:MAG: hypothetical protein WBV11_10475 [Salegentibacter sp.]